MPLLQNNSLNITCAIFIIVWTYTLLFPTHLNAKSSSYKTPRSLGTANITQQAFPMCLDCEQVMEHKRLNGVEKPLLNNTEFSTHPSPSSGITRTDEWYYTSHRAKSRCQCLTRPSSRQACPPEPRHRWTPRFKASGHGELTEGIIRHCTALRSTIGERRKGAPATERILEASAQHDQVLDGSPIKCIGARGTDGWADRTDDTRNSKFPEVSGLRKACRIIQNSTFTISTSLISGSGSTLPFHLHTNHLGTVDPSSINFLNRIRARGDLYKSEKFKLDYGADLSLRVSENSTAFFPELYAGAEYRAFRLDFGRFDRPIGLNNHDLSIGSMMVSRNAVPIPRIMFSTPDFTAVPWTNDILEFKAMYSHGWFTDERYVDDAYLHQKYLYLKVNTTESISVIGGIIHNAFWGGTHPEYGRAPRSFDDYLKIVFSKAADPGDNVNPGQIGNKLGNSLASYEFGIFYEAETYDLSITRLFYLEDSVSKRFRSPWDGVWGINLTFDEDNRLLNAITYEHINTRRQDAKSDQERGRAGYYNHSYYRSGWSHYSRTIGIPLITRNPETDRIDNNIIVGHHIGLTGNLHSNMSYRLLGTYTRNYGTAEGFYKAPRGSIDFEERREDRYSFLFEMNYSLKSIDNLSFSFSTAFDAGEFRESSIGGSLGVRYSFD